MYLYVKIIFKLLENEIKIRIKARPLNKYNSYKIEDDLNKINKINA